MKFKLNSLSLSKIAVYFIVIYCFVYILTDKAWQQERRVIEIDVIGYYGYLPASFIYQDLTFDFVDNYDGSHKFMFYTDLTPDGKKFVRYSMGMSYLYLPFFFMGHLAAHVFGYDTGGYSEPYKFFLLLSCLFYLAIGLNYLRKLLLNYFKDKTVAITLIILVMSTNLFHYIRSETTMSHSYSFAIISVFLYYVDRWYYKPQLKNAIVVGLVSGLFCVVRPFNMLATLIFVFYGLSSLKEIPFRFQFLLKKWYLLLIILVCFFVVWIPQLLYWKYITGSFFYYTYDVSGGKFFWNNPHILEGLFSYRKGWLLYNPIFWFAFLGLFFMRKYHKGYLIPFLVFLPIFIYCQYSWWSWWNGGSFGGRTMIDAYGLMAIPLAASVQFLFEHKQRIIRSVSVGLVCVFFLIGLKYNRQYRDGIIHYDGMTKEAFWYSFFKFRVPSEYYELLCRPDYDLARKGIYECEYCLGKYKEMEEKPRRQFAE